MNLFLTPDELEELTEYSRSKQQIAELARQGIPFGITRTGKPKVVRAALLQKFGVTGAAEAVESIDIDALNEVVNNGKKATD